MNITVLGAGSAYGTPMIFNTWGAADASNPRNCRSRCSILLEDAGKRVLVDAGPDLRMQINQAGIADINGVFITHAHYDHIAGLPELPRASKLLGHKIDIYASEQAMQEIKTAYAYLFSGSGEPDSCGLNWHLLKAGKQDVAGLSFNVFTVPHHNLQSYAFRYGDFAYVTDWEGLSAEAAEQINGADWLLAECNNGMSPEKNGHSSWPEIAERLEGLKVKNIVLTHLSARVDYASLQQRLPSNVKVAYDGLILSL